jgi:MFS-type transporter involved in bile tolerance (Atg22 family)
MTEGRKEEIKIRAAYFNCMAVTAFAIAALGPTVAMIASSPHDKPQILWVLLSILGLCLSYVLHTTARRLARTIDKD